MGQAYRLGGGVLVDLGTAQGWFEKAANKGHVDAQATLGLLLFQNGNQVEGLRWLKGLPKKAILARCWSTEPRCSTVTASRRIRCLGMLM